MAGRVEAEVNILHTLTTYLDDRNFVSRTPEAAGQLWAAWKRCFLDVGLWENKDKVKVVARKKACQGSSLLASNEKE